MKNLLFILCFAISFSSYTYGQVNCNDYEVVSIFDMPSTPQTPGGKYFLLLLTLHQDNLSNIDIYADIFFVDNLGDTISVPTGPSSTLPLYASDTIPYVLKLSSARPNPDFPADFDGNLVIVHSFQQQRCEVGYSNSTSGANEIHEEPEATIFPNPFMNFIRIESGKPMNSIFIVGPKGRIVDKFYPSSCCHEVNLEHLSAGTYFVVAQFEDGDSKVFRVRKI